MGSQQLLLKLESPHLSGGLASASGSTSKTPEAPLSERLRRFWEQRGDFSKFSLADLADDDADVSEKTDEAEQVKRRRLVIDWGSEGEANYGEAQGRRGDKGKARDEDPSPMTVEEFVAMKEEMMGKLQVAQQSLWSSQALVSLLVSGQRARSGSKDAQSLSVTRIGSRAETPSQGTGTGAPPSLTDQSKRPPAGSAAAVEAEFGLDPLSLAATAIERVDVKMPPKGEDEEDVDGSGKSGRVQLPEFANEAERNEYTQRMKVALAQKRRGLRKSIDILRSGAKRLDIVNGQPDAEAENQRTNIAETSSAERRRWRALQQAQRSGWGLTPGRPGRDIYGYSATRMEEGEQDVWIGYGLAESRPQYRRLALGYISHDLKPSKAATSSKDADLLVMPSRLRRRLRLTLRYGQSGTASTILESVSSSSNLHDDSSVDGRLQTAQAELCDRELFDELAAESRALARGSAPLVDCITSEHALTIRVGSEVELHLEMSHMDEEDGKAAVTPAVQTPFVSLIVAFARLVQIRRYESRARASAEAAQAEKEKSQGVHKKSQTNKAPTETSTGKNKGKPSTPAAATSNNSTKRSGQGHPRGDQDPQLWQEAPTLLPLLAIMQYTSFTSTLSDVLSSFCNDRSAHSQTNGQAHVSADDENVDDVKPFSQSSLHMTFSPLQSVSSSFSLVSLLFGSTSDATAPPNHPRAVQGLLQSLSGTATLSLPFPSSSPSSPSSSSPPPLPPYSEPLVLLTMSYPFHLTVTLPNRRRLDGRLGVTVDLDGGGGGGDAGADQVCRGLLVEMITGEVEDEVKRRRRRRRGDGSRGTGDGKKEMNGIPR